MKAIILAAGRGSRLKRYTEGRPKCLVELAGRPLLSWQLQALSQAGANDIAVVCGYKSEMIKALAGGETPFTPIENARWAETNMLASLWAAFGWAAGEECLISYSDIAYPSRHVTRLMACRLPIALTYDNEWEKLWRFRQGGNPLDDAETFRETGGVLEDIGRRPQSLDEVRGQYMGLLKVTPEGWATWRAKCESLGPRLDTTDMTGFLGLLLRDGAKIGAVAVQGAWCEVDSESDLELYEAALAKGTFSHDWRERDENGMGLHHVSR